MEIKSTGTCASGLGIPAHGLVPLVTHLKFQVNLHLLLALMEQLFLPLTAGTAPQCPCYGVKKSRLPMTVGPAQACNMDVLQMESRDAFTVGEEIA